MSELSNLSHIITEQATRIRELEAQILAERKCLRDEMAMAAISGLVIKGVPAGNLAGRVAYHIADDMLEARK